MTDQNKCQHRRYTVDVKEQVGTCYDCGAEGRMQFVVPEKFGEPLLMQALHSMQASRAQQPAPSAEPVAWGKVYEALGRLLEAYIQRHNPFHNPIASDAQQALREIWHVIPVLERFASGKTTYAALSTPTDTPEIDRLVADAGRAAWQPIETAPKDGTAILVSNGRGSWIAKHKVVYQSGYKPESPWFCLMLNKDHIPERFRTGKPTHWMPLPEAPGAARARGES